MERSIDVRKIQKTGRNTFIVSLPKAWADAKNVTPGMAAYVEQWDDGSLRIDVQGPPKSRTAAVDADGPQALQQTISAYIAGAETIVLNGKTATEVADKARLHLAAVDVISEAPRQVTLRVFATGQEYALSTLLRRMHAVITSLFDAAQDAFTGPGEAGRTAQRRESEANRLYTLALRSMGTGSGAAVTRFEALAANALENMADELEQFVMERPRHGKEALASVRAVYEETAGEFFGGTASGAAASGLKRLEPKMAALRDKSALEWARLNDVLRYCVELEDTASDVAAVRELTESSRNRGLQAASGSIGAGAGKRVRPNPFTGQKVGKELRRPEEE